jgi:CheY-like chemotaxis protein
MDRSLAVLLVEDEALIRMVVSDMLDELDHRIAGEAGDIESASSFAMAAEYDLAILDINLRGLRRPGGGSDCTSAASPASGYGAECCPLC